ncbi:FecR family protein [Persicobacter diffluens]|uniref:FecR family protein n=1 Tax=Persicobacter diffluens TaxID=981 RepID=A0AAN5ALX4_9BACT|nr:hypothetical protein PEDI_50020 [Persicobacter diffluens]
MAKIDKYIYDTDFIAWALGDHNLQPKWEAYLRQFPEEKKTMDHARNLLQAGLKVQEPEFSLTEKERLWARITTDQEQAQLSKRRSWPMMLAASVTLIILTIGLLKFFLPKQESVVAQAGEQFEYTLPDGSVAILNAVSSIKFNPASWTQDRTLLLEGEAFFEVKKGSQFKVQTPYGEVTVLGTSFNVNARSQDWEVSCYTGKVRVSNALEEVILVPGEKSSGRQKLGKKEFNRSGQLQPQWNQGLFSFDNQPLSQVFATIERQYNIQVSLPKKQAERKFSGTITNKNLNMALKVVCAPMALTYEIRDQHVIIQ